MTVSKKIFAPALLAAYCGIQSNFSFANILYADPGQNVDIDNGTYFFAGTHGANQGFLDEFKFSLLGGGDITASVNNSAIEPPNFPATDPRLVNNNLLTVSLFDSSGNFVTAAGAGSTLTASGLVGGATYTLAVSGKTSGVFGGVYEGELAVSNDAPAVPLPAAFPAFLSALLTLGWRKKKAIAEIH